MPNNQSFTQYVASRFDDEIFNAIADYINKKVSSGRFDDLELRLYHVKQVGEVELDNVRVKYVNAYNQPGMRIGFDITVEASILVSEGDYHYDEQDNPQQWFIIRCQGDLSKDLDDFKIIGEPEIYRQKDNHKQALSDNLVPIIDSRNYENAAQAFLAMYYPEARNNICFIDPMVIAKRIGLEVMIRPISSDCSIFGQCYFRDCDASFYNAQTADYETVHVHAGTIVVDPNTFFLYNLGRVNNTIIHECVHWVFHRKGFELDRLCNNASSMIGCRVVGGIQDRGSSAVSHMERQANAITPRIQMPKHAFDRLAKQYIYEAHKKSGFTTSDVDIIEGVIDQLATAFQVSRLSAKIRMAELGYEAAVGAFNWVDDHYVPTYSFKRGSLKPNQTFCIGLIDAALLSISNAYPLQKIISDGSYQYVENHFVLNTPKYLQTGDDSYTHLTEYARTHMDECCLAFDMEVKGYSDEYLTICYLDRDRDSKIAVTITYHQGLENSSPDVQKRALNQYLTEAIAVTRSFDHNFTSNLQKAFNWQKKLRGGLTYKELAKNIHLSEDEVGRIMNGKRKPEKGSLARICLGLQLPYFMTEAIFADAPCGALNYGSEEDVLVSFALSSIAGQSMESVDKFLADNDIQL